MTDVIEVVTGPPPVVEVVSSAPPVVEVATGPPGPPGPPGASTSVFRYRADANFQSPTDPGAGKLRWNTVDQHAATTLIVDRLTADGLDVMLLFTLTASHARFVIQDAVLSEHYQVWEQTGPAVLYSDWFTVPVAFVAFGGPTGVFAHNRPIAVLLQSGSAHLGTIGFVIDGGSVGVTPGVKGFFEVGSGCVITAVTVLSTDPDVTPGSCVIDLWKAPYTNYPPTAADSITASARPTLVDAVKSQDTALVGWTTTIAAGDVLACVVLSASGLRRLAVTLTVRLA